MPYKAINWPFGQGLHNEGIKTLSADVKKTDERLQKTPRRATFPKLLENGKRLRIFSFLYCIFANYRIIYTEN